MSAAAPAAEAKDEKKVAEGHVRLNSGHVMPLVGLGTWKAEPGVVGRAVVTALENGYRHIDCAAIYGNEKEIGEAFKSVFAKGVIKREDVFVTSKLWNTNHAKEHVLPALKQTLADLQLSYLDLYLVHHPAPFQHSGIPHTNGRPTGPDGLTIWAKVTLEETWKAMEALIPTGLVRSIGVSNYKFPQLVDLHGYATIIPAVNQVEISPYLARPTLVDQCARWGIHVTAYSAFGSNTAGDKSPLHNTVIKAIATKHSKSPAQVIIRWCMQRGISVLPMSTNVERIRQNFAVSDFSLTSEEMAQVNAEDRAQSLVSMKTYWNVDYYEA